MCGSRRADVAAVTRLYGDPQQFLGAVSASSLWNGTLGAIVVELRFQDGDGGSRVTPPLLQVATRC